jgi:hypothetical protein
LPRLERDLQDGEGNVAVEGDRSPKEIELTEQVTLREIQAQAHEETVEKDAQLLEAFVENNGACDLTEVARQLFHGNLSQALIAAIFADVKIQMRQEEFYGAVHLESKIG